MTQTQDAFRRENEPFNKKQSRHMNEELNFEVGAVTAVSHCESDVTAQRPSAGSPTGCAFVEDTPKQHWEG